jgi:hypothetical protein
MQLQDTPPPAGIRTVRTMLCTRLDLGTPATLMDGQMGHADGSVQARYSHITPDMIRRLLDGLTARWAAALDARRDLSPSSPVAVLDRLLRERAK